MTPAQLHSSARTTPSSTSLQASSYPSSPSPSSSDSPHLSLPPPPTLDRSSPSSAQSILPSTSDCAPSDSDLDLPLDSASVDDGPMMWIDDLAEDDHHPHDLTLIPSSSPSARIIGSFHHSISSSSPGPSWLPELVPNPHDRLTFPILRSRHHFKRSIQPASTTFTPSSSSRSASSPHSTRHPTPFSSPTPPSRHARRPHPPAPIGSSTASPSELRQLAASRVRTLERQNRSNARRPLLDAFSIGSRRGLNDSLDDREERILEALGRRHIDHLNHQWEDFQAYETDELIQEAQENDRMDEDHRLEDDLEPIDAYDDELIEYDGSGCPRDSSMTSTNSTIHPDVLVIQQPPTLLSILLDPHSSCPICSSNPPTSDHPHPRNTLSIIRSHADAPESLDVLHPVGEQEGVRCSSCHWFLDRSKLESVDRHFYQHGDRTCHRPLIGHNPYFGTHFACSQGDRPSVAAPSHTFQLAGLPRSTLQLLRVVDFLDPQPLFRPRRARDVIVKLLAACLAVPDTQQAVVLGILSPCGSLASSAFRVLEQSTQKK